MGNHVFICYAREDQDFVLKLAANLKERGARVWLDQWDISPSADWDLAIDNALYDCAQFLIVLSPAAIASREVRGELRTALDENKPIVPVLYQKCRIPRRLKLIQHVDFTACGPDDGAALGQVLRALGVRVPPPEPVRPRVTVPILQDVRDAETELAAIKAELDRNAQKYAKRSLWLYFGVLAAMWLGLVILTWQLGWDRMEPWVWFIGGGGTLGSYVYFVITQNELSPGAIYDQIVESKKRKIYQASGFDLERYERLIK